MDLAQFHTYLSQRIGTLNPGPSGAYRLDFEEAPAIETEYDVDTDTLHLYSVLATLPESGRLALLETLLAANLFGQATEGAVFAIDPSVGEILLCRSLKLSQLDETVLDDAFSSLLAQSQSWLDRLAPASEPSLPEPTLSPDFLRA